MDAKMVAHSMSPTLTSAPYWKLRRKPKNPSVVGVLARPADDIAAETLKKTNVYKDNWFDHLAINHLSTSVQAAIGLSNSKRGYESLVEAATMAFKKFSPIQQREIVIQALDRAFPKPILSLIRTLLPPSKFAREYFAVFTTLFFAWLVGPSEVRESEVNGRREKNVVHIKKCRFLEEANCVGMCINLCKMPSQSFIKDSLGMPVNMVPNFDDMSCEMIFGQDPPASTDDPALKQPCYKPYYWACLEAKSTKVTQWFKKLKKSCKRQGTEKPWNELPQLMQKALRSAGKEQECVIHLLYVARAENN